MVQVILYQISEMGVTLVGNIWNKVSAKKNTSVHMYNPIVTTRRQYSSTAMTERPITPEQEDVDLDEVPDALQEYLLRDVEVSGRELGVGSYSSVLELRYKGMKCAGKKLHRSLYDQGVATGPEILERFGTECELLSQLRHPRIVQFLGLHIEEGTDVPILVLEFMPFALSDTIEQYGSFPAEVSYSILHDVALGLHYLHENDPVIIHRDLTANNVLLTSNMTAKISDLGMAKIINLSPARMTHRMTVCPGTLSYMPPEALTSNPRYDTKLDSFSYGVLMLHIFCGEWPIASEYLQPDPHKPGHLLPLTEVQRREKYLRRLGSNHLLLGLIQRCLKNGPSERPEAATILEEVSTAAAQFPPMFGNRVEILNRIQSDTEEKQQLRDEIEELRRQLHEKEHEVENLHFTYDVEMERMREQVSQLEQTCKLQEAELSELRDENSRLQASQSAKTEEVELLQKQVEILNSELKQLEKNAAESLKKLRDLQAEVMTRSQEREAALQRLSRGQLDAALRHTFPGRGSEELANQFEEFFLHNADEITELIKRSQRSSNSTHLYSQQIVCSLVQHCYNHCKEKVLEQLSSRLNRVFSVEHNLESCKAKLQDISMAYGLLLRAAPMQESSQCCDALCEEVFPKFLEKNSIRLSRGLEGSLRQHARHICRLSWELVTCWPPLISARPSEFKEEWQDREYQYWDKSLTKFRLSYTRPVLFHSYEGRVGVKGWVGNREPVSGTGGGGVRRTPPTERGRRRTVSGNA